MQHRTAANHFSTTSWTQVLRAAQGGAALEELLKTYRWPVYAYLRRRGYQEHDADDLTQGFLCEVLLDGDLLQRARQGKGRFRSFLLCSLENYIIDAVRAERGRGQEARPRTFAIDDPKALAAVDPMERDDPHRAFDRQWATTVFEQALRRVEADCRGNGMARQWTAFEERVLRPAVQGCERTPVEELMVRLGATRRSEIDSMLQTIKRKLDAELREVIAETVDDPADVERELADLRQYLQM
jgi:RNA polymerase sigma factor (sigma-70 family)